MKTRPILLGTAGHIDHGKTSLVEALTGIDCDRLKVEKERGITTELGFAHLEIGKHRFGLIDVPGHERFIKAMVQGAGGLDLVLLVIAADEGIMPQTKEHLDICELLGVKNGLIALSKADLVDDEWLELMSSELRTAMKGRFLESAEIVPFSVKQPDSIKSLRKSISNLASLIKPRTSDGPFRMPIDRIFTVKGFGTVVTGSVISGAIKEGEAVTIQPRGLEGKVRSIEVHGETSSRVVAGTRAAINLSGVDKESIARGDMLTSGDHAAPSHLIDAEFSYVDSAIATLKKRTQILLHHGTAQTMANLILVNKDELNPGEKALVQLRMHQDHGATALPGDRYIARSFTVQKHYGTTIGGGKITRVHAPKVRRSSEAAQKSVEFFSKANDEERVAMEIKSALWVGSTENELRIKTGIPVKALASLTESLERAGEVARVGERFFHKEPIAICERTIVVETSQIISSNTSTNSASKAEIKNKCSSKMSSLFFNWVVQGLTSQGKLISEEDSLKLPDVKDQGLSELDKVISNTFESWGNTPERPKNVASAVGSPHGAVEVSLKKLVARGVLLKIKSDLLMHKDAVASLETKLIGHFKDRDTLTPSEWKTITNASRKFSIPLAEYFDAQKITLRVGDVRKKRRSS